MRKRVLLVIYVGCCSTGLFAQSSANFKINHRSHNSGGNEISGTNFKTKAFVGQRVTGTSQNANFNSIFGFKLTENLPPTDLTLSSLEINENQPVNSTVGTFTTTDGDFGDTFTYSFVTGAGGEDNGSFVIDGDVLKSGEEFDAETKTTYNIKVQTKDDDGGSFVKTFNITINDINDPPYAITLSNALVTENLETGTLIGSLTASDQDPGDLTFTFTLVGGQGDNTSFQIGGTNGDELLTNVSFDFEIQSAFKAVVRADDGNGGTFDKTFDITVQDANDTPTDIQCSNLVIAENVENADIGGLTTSDQDAGETFTYSLPDTVISNDNASYFISDTTLKTAVKLDYEAKKYDTIYVRTTDSDGTYFDKRFIIEKTDNNDAPTEVLLSSTDIIVGTGIDDLVARIQGALDQDNDAGDSHTFSLVLGYGDNNKFQINNNMDLVALDNFNTEGLSFSIKIRAKDSQGATYDQVFTMKVVSASTNALPTDIALSNDIVVDGQEPGLIGKFTTTDPNSEDIHDYSLVSGDGDNDNASFEIVNDELRGLISFDYTLKNTYSIRVRTDDNRGGTLDEIFIIEVKQDNTAPVVSQDPNNPNPGEIETVDNSVNIRFEIKDDTRIDPASVLLYYKGISEPAAEIRSLSFNNVDNEIYIFTLPLAEIGLEDLGVEYYISVEDIAGNSTKGETGYTYIRFGTESESPTIPGLKIGGKIEDYEIITIPFQLDDPSGLSIFNELGANGDEDWRLLHWDASQQDYRELGSNGGFSTLTPGQGYWFNSRKGAQVHVGPGQTVEVTRENPYTIQLQQGWNQIANPYPFILNWQKVLEENGNPAGLGDLYIYSTGNFSVASSLSTYRGGFIHWDGPEILDLSIPVLNQAGTGGRSKKNDEFASDDSDNWLINMTLRNGDRINNLGGFGMHRQAEWSKDRYDQITLPRFYDYLEINFGHPEYFNPKFSKDIVPVSANHTWEFEVAAENPGKDMELIWDSGFIGGSQYKLYLVDKAKNKVIDMRSAGSYKFDYQQSKKFQVYYGMEQWLEENMKPSTISVGEPFPNPFNHYLKIPVQLPADALVKVEIYSIYGDKVSTIREQRLEGGYNEIIWERDPGAEISGGTFILRVIVRNEKFYYVFNKKIIKLY